MTDLAQLAVLIATTIVGPIATAKAKRRWPRALHRRGVPVNAAICLSMLIFAWAIDDADRGSLASYVLAGLAAAGIGSSAVTMAEPRAPRHDA